MPSWLTRRRWILLLAGIFSAYVVVLLTNVYRSQQQLRSAAEARLLADTQQTAGVLGDLIAEQRNFVRNLAESHEIETFLINKALGMSMRYGLNANLYAIEESFRRKMALRQVMGASVYSRILYLDEQGALMADTSPGNPLLPIPRGNGPEPVVTIDAAHGRIIASVPINYRDTPGGTLMTVTSLELLSRFLASSSEELGIRQVLFNSAGEEVGGASNTLMGHLEKPHLDRPR